MTDNRPMFQKLAKLVVSDEDAKKRTREREERERQQAIWDGDPMRSAPKRHREASGLSTDGPWAEKLSWLKREAGKGILVALIGTRGYFAHF